MCTVPCCAIYRYNVTPYNPITHLDINLPLQPYHPSPINLALMRNVNPHFFGVYVTRDKKKLCLRNSKSTTFQNARCQTRQVNCPFWQLLQGPFLLFRLSRAIKPPCYYCPCPSSIQYLLTRWMVVLFAWMTLLFSPPPGMPREVKTNKVISLANLMRFEMKVIVTVTQVMYLNCNDVST